MKRSMESRYQKMTVDIARRIVSGQYQEGDKINARSTLANSFHVSSETARKAVCILVEMGILESRLGSGTYVVSRKKAAEYLQRCQEAMTLSELRDALEESLRVQQEGLERLTSLMNQFVDQTKHVARQYPLEAKTYLIDEDCPKAGCTIGELNFWQQTGATIAAIQRGEKNIVSPGPNARLKVGDILLYVGLPEVYHRVYAYMQKPLEEENLPSGKGKPEKPEIVDHDPENPENF